MDMPCYVACPNLERSVRAKDYMMLIATCF